MFVVPRSSSFGVTGERVHATWIKERELLRSLPSTMPEATLHSAVVAFRVVRTPMDEHPIIGQEL